MPKKSGKSEPELIDIGRASPNKNLESDLRAASRLLGPRASRPPRARNGAKRSAALEASHHSGLVETLNLSSLQATRGFRSF